MEQSSQKKILERIGKKRPGYQALVAYNLRDGWMIRPPRHLEKTEKKKKVGCKSTEVSQRIGKNILTKTVK